MKTMLNKLLGLVGLVVLSFGVLADDWQQAASGLTGKSSNDKLAAIEAMLEFDDPRNAVALQGMLDAELYYVKADRQLVIATKSGRSFLLTDLQGESLGEVAKSKIKRITVNNRIRREIRSGLAMMALAGPDEDARFSAVRSLMANVEAEQLPLVEQRLVAETSAKVQDKLRELQAIILLENGDDAQRQSSAEFLGGRMDAPSRNALLRAQADEQNAEVLAAINESVARNQQLLKLNRAAENLYFGLSLGAVLLLAAVGLAITFGVMGVINMAHGEMIMLGAYTTYVVQQLMPGHIELSLVVAIPAAFLVSGAMGVLIERGIIRFLYGRPLETLLATFGLSLVLQQLVRSIFGPLNQAVITPQWLSGSLEINGVLALTYNRLYIIIFSFMVVAALWLLISKTFFGLQVRAVTQNRAMANAMGIRSSWVDAMTFGLGSGVAGIAGVALSQLTNVGPNLGQNYIIDSFMVVVFGGVGNLFGTVVAAMTLGVANKLAEPFTGAVLAKILVLVFIILFIQKRPRGMFALKGRMVED